MNSVDLFFSSSDEDDPISVRLPRTDTNILELPDNKFKEYFKLSKDSFQYVLQAIGSKLENVRATAVPPTTKLATTLRFLAQGSYQVSVGNDYNITLAQPTVSKVIRETLNAMEEVLCPEWISMEMSEAEKLEAKEAFYTKAGLPGVIMCVDGTHIKIIAPEKEQQHLYFNHKGFYSMNVMIVCDHKSRIRFIDARHPGASHDSFIWNCSQFRAALKRSYDAGDRNSWVLGDAEYPLEPFIMTPYRSAQEKTPESNFNIKHSITRNIIERVIGIFKSRFRCLLGARQLHYKPPKVIQIVNVCAAVHNICIHYDKISEDEEFNREIEAVEVPNPEINEHEPTYSVSSDAIVLRDRIRDNLT